ncbi:MAG: efflux RND transporter periplasmic adaptor subunit [Candidatus Promineifilaceae bacterium]
MQATAQSPTKKRRPIYWIVLLVIVGLIVAGTIFYFRSRANAATADVQTGDQVAAFIGDLSVGATASGQVEAVQTAILSVEQPGIVEEVLVTAGTPVNAGDPLLQLDQRDLKLQVAQAEQNVTLKEADLEALLKGAEASDIAAAEAAVKSAQANFDNLLAGPTTEEIAASEANIRQQQAGVWSASAGYNSTADSIKESAIASAEADLVAAQIEYNHAKERNEDFAFSFTHEAMIEAQENLAIAQAKVDELKAGPNQGSLNSASADISAAQANLNQARADYDSLISGASETQISAARATLARSQSDLADLKTGAGEQEIAIAQAQLDQARLDLQAAEQRLADSTISAPFDGLVTKVFVSIGERASGQVLELVSSDLQAVLQVDELDIASLVVGQPAELSFESWPGQSVSGTICSIAPSSSKDANSIVNYDVTVQFDADSLPVLVGMTADARVITAEKEDVLLVPNAAITANRGAGTYSVNLVTGEEEGEPVVESREVTIGLRDDEFTQILSGLSEGDTVLIGELAAPTIDFGAFGNGGDE